LGVVFSDKFSDVMEKIILGLKIGEISKPEETPFGYQIIKREKPEEIFLGQVLISYKGADNASKGIIRTKKEAEKRAAEVYKILSKDTKPFKDVVKEYSDSPLAPVNRGFLGRVSKGFMPDDLEKVAFELKMGQVSNPVETKSGYYILKRFKEVKLRHILISYRGSKGTKKHAVRTKKEAGQLAELVSGRLQDGEDFAMMAMQYSDAPSRTKGGNMKTLIKGMMPPEFDKVAFSLKKGEISPVIETSMGFHIIKRVK
jgi:parvulin-like peptidyl-prolyl isomerase